MRPIWISAVVINLNRFHFEQFLECQRWTLFPEAFNDPISDCIARAPWYAAVLVAEYVFSVIELGVFQMLQIMRFPELRFLFGRYSKYPARL
jgi:hypothetical protein